MRNTVKFMVRGACLLLACLLLFWVLARLTSSPDTTISRTQLEGALHKWKAQGVVEYKMVVDAKPGYPFSDLAGVWTVSVNSNAVQATNGQGQVMDAKNIWFLTVDGQFSDVESRVMHSEQGQDDKRFSMSASFDQSLGYPTAIDVTPKRWSDPLLLFYAEDVSIKVTSLDALSTK